MSFALTPFRHDPPEMTSESVGSGKTAPTEVNYTFLDGTYASHCLVIYWSPRTPATGLTDFLENLAELRPLLYTIFPLVIKDILKL